MSTATAASAAHLSREEREALIARLREFGSQQEQSQKLADQGSLDRAAELMRLYEDKSWMDEIPAPGPRSKMPADDFRRFTKWATTDDRLGLPRRRITQLQHGSQTAVQLQRLGAQIAGLTSETALRPLRWMVNNDYAGQMCEVWRDAVQLADGESPSESQVKRALLGWKKRNLPKGTGKRSSKPKGAIAQAREWRAKLRGELEQNPEVYGPMLEDLIAEYKVAHADGPQLAGVDY